ncbi:hypothetical protein tloyanaT_26300 [Thalassotalea loyana]|uniref:Tape measure protein N-terminal domain-containing protein n=1 Tax=Thalassotalea loyana TaxID=280483 RepID=A0ABQ6HFL2_9GAMM|nr:tape measure protein [Thalassotalea loyana]GLX86377.1 hypothetical protein tloyanaT_26300 [Thalassotalea loyana]
MNDMKVGVKFEVDKGNFKGDVNQNANAVEHFGSRAKQASGKSRELGVASKNTSVQVAGFGARVTNTSSQLNQLSNQSLRTQRNLSQLSSQSQITSVSMQQMTSMALGLVGAFQTVNIATSFKTRLAELQDMEVRLRNLSQSSQDYADNEKYLAQLAQEHSKNIISLGDSYSKLLALEKGNLVTRKESRELLEGMSDAASALGADSTQLEQSLFGMAQGFSAGTLQAQELGQVTDPLPSLLQALDKAANLASGGFKKLVVEGKVTSQLFKQTLIKALKEYEGAAASTFENISARQERLVNKYFEMVKAYEAPISFAIGEGFDIANASMELFTDNTQTITTLVQGGLVIALGHGISALTSFTAAKVNNVASTQSQLVANAQLAKSEQQLAVASQARAVQEQAAAKRQLANAKSAYARTAAIKNLAIANGQLAASERALTVTTNNLTLATNKLSIARRGLSTLSSLLGGLPGILTIAAFGMYSFAQNSNQARQEALALSNEIKALSENYRSLSLLQLQSQNIDLSKNIENQRAEVTRLSQSIEVLEVESQGYYDRELKRWIELPGSTEKGTEKVIQAKAKQEKATQVLNEQLALQVKLEKQIIHLQNGGKPSPTQTPNKVVPLTPPNTADKLNQQAETYLNNLHKQTVLLGDKSEVARLAYELEHGSLQGINEEMRKKLELQAKELDAQQRKAELMRQFEQTAKAITAPTTAEGREQQTHDSRVSILENTLQITPEDEVAQRQRIHALLEQEHERHKQALESIEAQKKASLLGNASQLFDGLAGLAYSFAGEQSGIFKVMFAASKAFAVAESIIKIQQGIANAAALPFPTNIPAIGQVISATSSVLSTIKGTQLQGVAHNGLNRVPASHEGTFLLRKDEMVLNPKQRDNFEYLVNFAKQKQPSQGINNVVKIENHFNLSGSENENSIRQTVEMATERMRAELIEDLSSGGVITQHMRAAS